uniref:Oxidation resistance protein 1 n=1 Tax=Odontella aurita TaxID=265563 RepID=A0A7S4K0T0_9STRA
MVEEIGSSEDESDIDAARNRIIDALSAHGTAPNGSTADGSAATNVSSNAEVGSSAASETLTDSEVSFLSSLLNDPKVHPKYVKRASRRLSDANLFPPPRSGDILAGGDGNEERQRQRPSISRDHSLQEELFRKHERSGMKPSLVLKQLSSHASINSSSKSQRIRRSGRGSSGQVVREESSLGIIDARLTSKKPPRQKKMDGDTSGAKERSKRTHVVRNASHLSQGFEVTCQSAHSAPPLGGSGVGDTAIGKIIKEDRQMQFRAAEGGKLFLSGLDQLEGENSTNGDLCSDAAVRPKSQMEEGGQKVHDDVSSWDLSSELCSDGEVHHYQPDAWDVLRDEYAWEYGFGGGVSTQSVVDVPSESRSKFKILGTSAEDKACHPHVLSPPLMESLLAFMPETVADCNYFLKFSLVRDGPSLYQLLRTVRGSVRTVLAVETTEGYVFGSFTSAAWRPNRAYFGSHESFVWRMRQSRLTACHSIVEQAIMESELEVFPYTGNDNKVQMCHADMIGLGGSDADCSIERNGDESVSATSDDGKDQDYGFALSFSPDLTHGNTSASETFGNPCLVKLDAKGASFNVANLEIWSMTPFETSAEAEKDELARLFFFEEEDTRGKKLNIFRILMGSPMRD